MFKLDGWKELEKALGELPSKATKKNTVRRALKKAAEPILSDMKANAPRDKGVLVSHLDMSGSLTANERKGTGPEFLGIGENGQKIFGKQAARNFVEIHVGATGKKQNSPVAMWAEFGTEDTQPTAFGRRAFEANKMAALQVIGTELGKEIEKAAARAAKKRAKGA